MLFRLIIWILIPLFFTCSYPASRAETQRKSEPVYHPLENKSDLDPLLSDIKNSRIVLLGEASHGTREFYAWRDSITKRLIAEKGFNIIAIEGDWSDAMKVMHYINSPLQNSSITNKVLDNFIRWPQWLWSNEHIASLVHWLHEFRNRTNTHIGFYGLDLFSIAESATGLLPFVQATRDTNSLNALKDFLVCFQKFNNNEQEYQFPRGRSQCGDEANKLYNIFSSNISDKKVLHNDQLFMMQSAIVIKNGEHYFRTASTDRNNAWNFRDTHMQQTIERVIRQHGNAKVIVWAHNNHVGDAGHSTMSSYGRTNLGQLLRATYNNDVYTIGFGFFKGNVLAAERWGNPYRIMPVPPAVDSSWENLFHQLNPTNKLFLSKEQPALLINKWLSHIGLGVVYDPRENYSGSRSALFKRYDAFMYFDSTHALKPLK